MASSVKCERLFRNTWQCVGLVALLTTIWQYTRLVKTVGGVTKAEFNIADVCVVGAGLSGAVIAERYATQRNQSVLVLERRPHIGGNCYDYIDEETGIRVNLYGAHLFHTHYTRVWDYVHQFAEWVPYEHRVLAFVKGKHVPVPVNIDTVNALFGLSIRSEAQMDDWLLKEQVSFPEPQNSEETALSRVGPRLYDLLFKPYTVKQWDKTPAELGPEVLARIPVRNNHDPRYFGDPYQALPKDGYTAVFERMFDHPLITVRTNVDYFDVRDTLRCGRTYFTGPIDAYFGHLGWPKLEYRSLDFERKVVRNIDYFQPNSVVNHPSPDVDFTRIVEYKHMLNQSSPHTAIFYERSKDGGEPYYPVPNPANKALYAKYQAMAAKEPRVTFVGRLANYKYFNMDQTVKNALELFDRETAATVCFDGNTGMANHGCGNFYHFLIGTYAYVVATLDKRGVLKRSTKVSMSSTCGSKHFPVFQTILDTPIRIKTACSPSDLVLPVDTFRYNDKGQGIQLQKPPWLKPANEALRLPHKQGSKQLLLNTRSTGRHLLNPDALDAVLGVWARLHGFKYQRIDSGTMTPAAQFRAFQTARIVVQYHGAANSWGLVMPQEALMVEIQPPGVWHCGNAYRFSHLHYAIIVDTAAEIDGPHCSVHHKALFSPRWRLHRAKSRAVNVPTVILTLNNYVSNTLPPRNGCCGEAYRRQESMMYQFIHPTKSGGTALDRHLKAHYSKWIHGTGANHQEKAQNYENPIVVIRDPYKRAASMFRYWKFGTKAHPRDAKFKARVASTTLEQYLVMVENRDPALRHGSTWGVHWKPTSHWITPDDYAKSIVVEYSSNLDSALAKLLEFIGVRKKATLEHVNTSEDVPVLWTPKAKTLVRTLYAQDFELVKAMKETPSRFALVVLAPKTHQSIYDAYKAHIDAKIDALPRYGKPCSIRPLFQGEFGYELQGIVPWYYDEHVTKQCDLTVTGVQGMRYLYWFASSFDPIKTPRSDRRLPLNGPLKSGRPHVRSLPLTRWTMPPWREFFGEALDTDALFPSNNPILMVFNKHTMEWGRDPVNFIDVDTLRRLLTLLTPSYQILYVRMESADLRDSQADVEFRDKEMIRNEHPSVVLYEDLYNDSTMDYNLLLFGLAAKTSLFVSVQGGNSVVASLWGAPNCIYAVRGYELKVNAYEAIYGQFGGSKIWATNSRNELVQHLHRYARLKPNISSMD